MAVQELRDAIFSGGDLELKAVQVQEWGGIAVYIRVMSLEEQLEWEDIAANKELRADQKMAGLLVRTLCDDKGEPLFKQTEAELLTKRNKNAIMRLFKAAQDHNTIQQLTDAAAKNSEPSPGA